MNNLQNPIYEIDKKTNLHQNLTNNKNNTLKFIHIESITLTFKKKKNKTPKNYSSSNLNNLKLKQELRLKRNLLNYSNYKNKSDKFLPKINIRSSSNKEESSEEKIINSDTVNLHSEYEIIKSNLKEINP